MCTSINGLLCGGQVHEPLTILQPITAWHIVSFLLTSLRLVSPQPTPPHLSTPHLSTPRLTSLHLTSPHLTTPRLSTPRIASPHLASPRITSPRLASPRLGDSHPYLLAVLHPFWLIPSRTQLEVGKGANYKGGRAIVNTTEALHALGHRCLV